MKKYDKILFIYTLSSMFLGFISGASILLLSFIMKIDLLLASSYYFNFLLNFLNNINVLFIVIVSIIIIPILYSVIYYIREVDYTMSILDNDSKYENIQLVDEEEYHEHKEEEIKIKPNLLDMELAKFKKIEKENIQEEVLEEVVITEEEIEDKEEIIDKSENEEDTFLLNFKEKLETIRKSNQNMNIEANKKIIFLSNEEIEKLNKKD